MQIKTDANIHDLIALMVKSGKPTPLKKWDDCWMRGGWWFLGKATRNISLACVIPVSPFKGSLCNPYSLF